VRMERAGGAERGDFGILRWGRTSSGHAVNNNTSITTGSVKDIRTQVSAIASVFRRIRRPGAPCRWPVLDEMMMTDGTKSC
jgi:hypothetical protein